MKTRLRSTLMKLDKNRVVIESLRILSAKDRKKLYLVIILQVLLSFLDLAALAVVGLLGSVAVKGLNSPPGANISLGVLDRIMPLSMTFQSKVAILGLMAGIFLVGRSILTIRMNKKTLFFLSTKGYSISAVLITRLLSLPLLQLRNWTTQEAIYSVTIGVSRLLVGVIGTGIQMIADLSLLILMALGLFVVDPLVAGITFILFSCISAILYFILSVKASKLGEESANLNIASNELVNEVLLTYREAFVKDRRGFYANAISAERFALARTDAEIAFMPTISKYVIEIATVLGAIVICGTQFALKDASQAIATLVVFLTAGSRIAPAVLRLQQGALGIRTSISAAKPTIEMIHTLPTPKFPISNYSKDVITDHEGFESSVEIQELNFSYPESNSLTIQNLNLEIKPGQVIAVVGPSGAGKTTLVDLLLGVIDPDSGSILISGQKPKDAIRDWPGAISYLPQELFISNGSLRKNVLLGFEETSLESAEILEILKLAALEDFVSLNPDGLDMQLGERGGQISGGQRQRIGIARSLVTKPKLLVLDEATSALDASTELQISNAIQLMRGSVTIIVIAHRLTTVKLADMVVYMDSGRVVKSGTYEEIYNAVPEFATNSDLNDNE